jgi:hypothetical protein
MENLSFEFFDDEVSNTESVDTILVEFQVGDGPETTSTGTSNDD